MKRRQFLVIGLLAAGLGGCAELATKLGTDADADADADLGPLWGEFSIGGRMSLRQGERSDHLRFEWTHSPRQDIVLLLSPLGQGLAELVRDDDGARLIRPGEAVVVAADVRSLAQQLFGMPLPLDLLADWLRGARGRQGIADGWQIEVADLAPPRQRRVSRRISAVRDDVELVLIVDDWNDDE